MPHDPAGMAIVEDPTKRLGKVIRRVDDAGDEAHDNVTGFFPVLDREVLNINMPGALRGDASVDHVDRRLVVTMEACRTGRRKSQFPHDRPEVFGMLGRSDSRKEFRLSRTGGRDGLCLAAVGDSAARQDEGVASGGPAVAKVVGMSGVDESLDVERRVGLWEGGKVHVGGHTSVWGGRETGIAVGLPIDDAPVLGGP